MAFLLPAHSSLTQEELEAQILSPMEKLKQLDPIGTVLILPSIACLLLALQWGGFVYSWSNPRIIVLWVVFASLVIVFVAVQICAKETATIPPRIAKYRSVTASTWFAFCAGASLMTIVYYLPVWFQAIKVVSAIEFGIRLLPLIIALVVSIIFAGGSISNLGYYTPFMILCSVIMAIGAGLVMTFRTNTGHARWIGYQVTFSFGIGLGQQQPGLAAQRELPDRGVLIGVTFKFFGQQLGGAIFVSVAQNILSTRLLSGLTAHNLTHLDPDIIVKLGATELRNYVEPGELQQMLDIYNDALVETFEVATILAALSTIGAVLTKWKSVRGTDLKGA